MSSVEGEVNTCVVEAGKLKVAIAWTTAIPEQFKGLANVVFGAIVFNTKSSENAGRAWTSRLSQVLRNAAVGRLQLRPVGVNVPADINLDNGFECRAFFAKLGQRNSFRLFAARRRASPLFKGSSLSLATNNRRAKDSGSLSSFFSGGGAGVGAGSSESGSEGDGIKTPPAGLTALCGPDGTPLTRPGKGATAADVKRYKVARRRAYEAQLLQKRLARVERIAASQDEYNANRERAVQIVSALPPSSFQLVDASDAAPCGASEVIARGKGKGSSEAVMSALRKAKAPTPAADGLRYCFAILDSTGKVVTATPVTPTPGSSAGLTLTEKMAALTKATPVMKTFSTATMSVARGRTMVRDPAKASQSVSFVRATASSSHVVG